MSESANGLLQRKFFYLFTCEYCFSHYVAAIFLVITRFKLLYPDWRGYLISWFALVWLSNVYMALFANIRLDIHSEGCLAALLGSQVWRPLGAVVKL
ncbi:MAG TPA: hypothetical protein VNZ03_13000 [Terriglobales bacterium]|nr:hypothetical protein [Terriglobales bacterium]